MQVCGAGLWETQAGVASSALAKCDGPRTRRPAVHREEFARRLVVESVESAEIAGEAGENIGMSTRRAHQAGRAIFLTPLACKGSRDRGGDAPGFKNRLPRLLPDWLLFTSQLQTKAQRPAAISAQRQNRSPLDLLLLRLLPPPLLVLPALKNTNHATRLACSFPFCSTSHANLLHSHSQRIICCSAAFSCRTTSGSFDPKEINLPLGLETHGSPRCCLLGSEQSACS
ncbi:hypothetical protein B0J18DRAFT_176563 [Chaetomium sp. MPI-SDFR-AT-0129]|nr:hypothetical protein B0J18DRAFT_176563 [Chaetomium sp. MPI-SDFR-AT-0129]